MILSIQLRCEEAPTKFKNDPTKSDTITKQTSFLKNTISEKSIQSDDRNGKAILNMFLPSNVEEVEQCCALITFYGRYIHFKIHNLIEPDL